MDTINHIELKGWVDSYTNELYSRALHMVSNVELAKQLVKDTFLTISDRMPYLQDQINPKTELLAILNHKISVLYQEKLKLPNRVVNKTLSNFFDTTGRWKTEKYPEEWAVELEHLLLNNEFQLVLKKCLESLPAKWNICLKLKYIPHENKPIRFDESNINIANYLKVIHFAKLQLRASIDNNLFKR